MLISKILKVNLILFSLFLSLIAVSADAKTGLGKATETEISLVDGITSVSYTHLTLPTTPYV